LKPLTLELGGNDAAIVLADADPERVAEKLFWGAFENSGQVCVAIKRLYIHESIAARLTVALAERIRSAKVGAAMDEGVELGPVNNAPQFERVSELVDDARRAGGVIEAGGAPLRKGYFYAPTLVSGLSDDSRLVREEQFGPALPVLTFRDDDDAFARANDTPYGLAGSIWSSNPERAAGLAAELQCGTVWINQHLTILPVAPISGWKSSGLGVENGQQGLFAFTQLQTVEISRA
jgi:acyl-CoA reductase-like NAD-dependent aldehyde dehydrogenase